MVNPRRTDRAALAETLAAEGIVAEPSSLSPLALVVRSGNALASPRFRAGHFAVQDAAGQALPRLLPESDTLVDVAAAPGGKAFAAVALGRFRRVIALDRSPARLRLLVEARARLGFPEVAARWRLSPDAVERLARAQESSLAAAARLLAPGGFLLYSTCSLEEEENERVVARALERDPGLEPSPIDPPEGLAPFVEGARLRIFPSPDTDGFTAHLLRRRV